MQKTNYLKLASRNGIACHVDDVASGLACGCVCVCCGDRLVAKKGAYVQHHFAHTSGAECAGAAETALHLAAKQAIVSHRRLSLPAARLEFKTPHPPYEVCAAETVHFDQVRLEQPVGELVVDVVGEVAGRRVGIEVYVTHAVDDNKRQRLADLGLATVEIDLSTVRRDLRISEIEQVVVDGMTGKRWLHHVAMKEALKNLVSQAHTLPMVVRNGNRALHVDWCPLKHWVYKGTPYANVSIHCRECEHALDIQYDKSVVICTARREEPSAQQLWLF